MLLAEGRRAVTVSSTAPFTAVDATGATYRAPEGAVDAALGSRTPVRGGTGHGERHTAARDPAGQEGAPRARRTRVPRKARARPARGVPARRERRRARELPPGRGRGGGAAQLARRGRSRRRPSRHAPTRSRASSRASPSTSTPTCAARSISASRARRRRRRRRSRRHGRRGRPLRREGRDDVLLLDVGRQDCERARRLRDQRAVPRVAAGSVGQGLAVPPLGPGPARRAHGADEARRRRSGRRRRPRRPTPSGRLRSLVVQTTAGSETVPASLVRTALGLRSTWITVGVIRLDRPSTSAVAFGSTARLAGIVRGLGTPRLASSPDGAVVGRRRRSHLRQDGDRHGRRQAGANDPVPARGRGRRVSGAARPGAPRIVLDASDSRSIRRPSAAP